MSWTEPRIETLKKLWAEGLSASQIATEMGCCSRSAVLGKVHRMRLPERRTRNAVVRTQRIRSERRADRIYRIVLRPGRSKRYGGEVETVAVQALPRELPTTAIPFAQRKTLVELTETSCRWPCGDPGTEGFFFCGGDAVLGMPYCGFHSRIAYRVRIG